MNSRKITEDSENGPLASMREYLCEFDPDTGPVASPPSSQLHSAWTTYVQAFEDLCQVQNIPENNKKPLFLLLGGMKLRERVNQLTAGNYLHQFSKQIFPFVFLVVLKGFVMASFNFLNLFDSFRIKSQH